MSSTVRALGAAGRWIPLLALLLAGGCAEIADLEPDAGPGSGGPAVVDARLGGPDDDDGGDGGGDPVDAGPIDAAPCTPGKVQLLGNPSFDQGAVTWAQVDGPLIFPDAQVPINVHSPDFTALLGRAGAAQQKLSQPVEIPAGTTSLVLSLYTCFVTGDNAASTDSVKIALLGSGGAVVETLKTYTRSDAVTICNFAKRTVTAASPHAGESLVLALSGTSDAAGLTSFYIDTLSLEANVSCP
jgi:hypothetical protein